MTPGDGCLTWRGRLAGPAYHVGMRSGASPSSCGEPRDTTASARGMGWRVSPTVFRYIALSAVITLTALIVSGGAVRLTGSGLGCPDWPSCTQHHYVAPVNYHALVEFVNRVFSLTLSVSLAATVIAAVLRAPRRKDLTLLTAGLMLGVIGQIMLGGMVVLYKLAPTLVMGHFLLSIVMVADALVLYHRSGIEPVKGVAMVPAEIVWLSRGILVTVGLVITLGTAVTGSGPHSGSASVARLPFSFRDMAWLHADAVLFLVGMTLATQVALRVGQAPPGAQRRGRVMMEAMVAQGALGYTQYFLHVPALLVGFHLLGAALVVIATLRYHLGLFAHPAPMDPPLVPSAPPAVLTAGH